ncbi:hypothetical protein ACJJIF_02385 [Microbulbifer sp. SSSA002]|uniref:hypothetical protein n=1 Tax=Microbulbifer sp. SSSA002 TaxID=3243376 RepID=UPI0040396E63
MKKILLFTTLLFLSGQSAAEVVSGWTKIDYLTGGWSDKRINLVLSSIDSPDPAGCNYSNSKLAQADDTSENFDQMLSMALSAHLAEREVSVVISESQCSLGGRPKIVAVYIR